MSDVATRTATVRERVGAVPSKAALVGDGFGVEEFLRNFETIAESEGGVKLLRGMVLELAVRGKLSASESETENEPLDGTLYCLPDDWSWVRLADLGKFVGGGTPSKSNPSFWKGDLPWVSPKDMKRPYIDDAIDHISVEAVSKSSVKLIPPNSLLCVVRGMILSHSFPVAITTREVTVNQDMKALVFSRTLNTNFILLACQAARDRVLSMVERSSHGTCRLESEKLEALWVPLPPLAEQKRIVAKVDALMALCDELEARQAKKRELAARLTGAALGALTSAEGPEELDAAWARVAGSFATVVDRSEKVAEVRRAVLDTLISPVYYPNSMSTLLSRLLLVPLANGRSVPDGNGFPVLRLSALRNQFVNFEDHKRGDWTSDDADRFVAQANDLLVVRGNGALRLVGRACIVGGSVIPVAFPDTMIRVRVDPQLVDVFWLWYFWETSNARMQIERKARTTSGIFKVAQDDISSLVIPLPLLAEQKRIVAKVDQLMAICDELGAGLRRAEEAAAALAKAAVAAVVG